MKTYSKDLIPNKTPSLSKTEEIAHQMKRVWLISNLLGLGAAVSSLILIANDGICLCQQNYNLTSASIYIIPFVLTTAWLTTLMASPAVRHYAQRALAKHDKDKSTSSEKGQP